MEMQKALRNITNDGTVAASVLFNVGGFLKSLELSEAERLRMTLGIAQAGANLGSSSNCRDVCIYSWGKNAKFRSDYLVKVEC